MQIGCLVNKSRPLTGWGLCPAVVESPLSRNSLQRRTCDFRRSFPPSNTRGLSSLKPLQAATGIEETATYTNIEKQYTLPGGIIDYYSLLGVDDNASFAEIKKAYRALAKVCHPDRNSDLGRMCVLVNEAYEVLSDPVQRTEYNSQLDEALTDDEDGYTGQPLSKWCANNKNGKNTEANEERAVFVDEVTCIGCKQCVWAAPATFRIEDAHGRSRVFGQWLDTEENLQAAIDVCPVSCIHWVNRQDLPALEYVVQNCMGRTNVGLMMSGQGGFIDDVFQRTARFLRERVAREEARERAKKYSAAQEAARRAAADAMAQQRGNANDWLSQFADRVGVSFSSGEWPGSLSSSFSGSMSSMDMDMEDEYSQYKRVGKRNKNNNNNGGGGGGGGGGRGAVATNGNGNGNGNGSVSDDDEGGSYSDGGGSGSNGVPDDRALVPSSNGKARWQR